MVSDRISPAEGRRDDHERKIRPLDQRPSRFRTGLPWRDLPEFGDWKTVHQRFSRWAKSGVFEGIFKLLASDHDNEYMMIDATIVRAHQHSAGARKKTARKPSADRAED